MAESLHFLPSHKKRTGDARVVFMDFRRPDKFSMEQIRSMSIIHEQFARLLSVKLSAMLRQEVSVHLYSVDQVTYGEFTDSYDSKVPATFAVLNNKRIKSSAMFTLDNRLTHLLQSRLYGCVKADDGSFNGFSPLSSRVMTYLFKNMLPSLNSSWETLGDFPFGLASLEHNIQFAQILPPGEMTILMTWEVKTFGKQFRMEFCLPSLFMEPLLPRLSAQWYFGDRERKMQNLKTKTFRNLKIPGRVECACAELTLHEVLIQKKGDLIPIDDLNRNRAVLIWGGKAVEELIPHKNLKDMNLVPSERSSHQDLNALLSGKDRNRSTEKLETLNRKVDDMMTLLSSKIDELNKGQDFINDQILLNEDSPSEPLHGDINFISEGDLEFLKDLLKIEPFQVNALLLSQLASRTAASYLESFTADEQSDLAGRISHLEPVSPEILSFLAEYLKEQIVKYGDLGAFASSGLQKTVDIFQYLRRSTEISAMTALEQRDPELAAKLMERMFVFEDLFLLHSESLRLVFEKAEEQDMVLALKLSDTDLQEKILSKLPGPDAESYREKVMRSGRKFRLSTMEEAQLRITELVRDMEKGGLITLDEEAFG